MPNEYNFQVAGFHFCVHLSECRDVERLIPSFRPFRLEKRSKEKDLFSFVETPVPETDPANDLPLDDFVSDMGRTRLWKTATGYRVEIRHRTDGAVHCLCADSYFTFVRACLRWDDPYAGEVLSSMLRIVFSQAVIYQGGISLHAAAVVLDGKAYLFMGKSGTGKSTHAALWQRCFPGCELLNDDNPMVCLVGNIPTVYGTPWSGKTPCYKNRSYPIGGIVRLRQEAVNRFLPRYDVEAFSTVLPGCSVVHSDRNQYGALCDTLVRLVGEVPVGELECLPNEEAARTCREGFAILSD